MIIKGDLVQFDNILESPINLSVGFKILSTEGNLVYEYNPFRNLRLNNTLFTYKNKTYTSEELRIELNKSEEEWKTLESSNSWPEGWIPEGEEEPILLAEKGELYDFETDQLKFDINHPVDILPQYSYDGSVNLILNDGINQPRLINSRFSPTGRNKYEIVDRAGDNDTNIYDQGDQFDIDTSLYKRVTTIPKLTFSGVNYSGNLPIGNYHFYFKYEDPDGNQTDYIAESGLVSMFIGNEPYNIQSGFRDQNSRKGVSFVLQDLDSSYQYISVYYTRNTSDINQNAVVSAYKIDQRYLINNANICNVLVTGFENTTQVDISEINPNYQVVQDAFTQAQCQNMLFLANVHKPDIPYSELQDISLRFYPSIDKQEYNIDEQMNQYYELSSNNTYYNPNFIYNKVGYWPDEIYRFGVVYILSDNTLSPVFNIRGIKLNDNFLFTDIPFEINGSRNYISFDEQTFLITQDGQSSNSSQLENSKGVIYIPQYDNNYILGITIKLQNNSGEENTRQKILSKLQELGIKGYFFVRQKRIPTTLCQAFTIGNDPCSHLPAIPNRIDDKDEYIIEKFLDDDQLLTHNLSTYSIPEDQINLAAICPEFDINPEYFNQLFTGDSFIVNKVGDYYLQQDSQNNRHFVIKSEKSTSYNSLGKETKIIAIEDNVKLVSVEDTLFSARAGEAEEGYRYEYIGYENKVTKATNLARGSYGPYLGFSNNFAINHNIVDIKIPHYSQYNMQDYFNIRYHDKSSYYAISDRIKLEDILSENTYYRGDCYICQFTHRVNRNFSDPSAPTNDKIVDEKCWKNNYSVSDGVVDTDKFDEINLGDINAIKMGLWVTLWIRSNSNLYIRAVDDSRPSESSLFGQGRAFYPYQDMRTEGNFKLPESTVFNKGFEKGLSERYNFELPNVPYIKNEFSNRILYSDINVNDAFKNGFRVFQGTHYRDYPKTYGSITKIVEFRGNLICVFEHGIVLIPVNERAVAGEGSGGNIYINTSNVLPENPVVISDTYGSQWRESIIKTSLAVYGVDTVGKKIWRTNGREMEYISDFKIQKFLNDNISLSEREITPIIGIRNVKTHFNKFKKDILFTFYDNLSGFTEKVWNLCFNEDLQKWITFYSWVPSYSENIDNIYFSFNRDTSKYISKLGMSKFGSAFSDGIITLEDNIITEQGLNTTLHLSDKVLPSGDGVEYSISYELKNNQQLFKITGNTLQFIGDYSEITLQNSDKVVIFLNIKANINRDNNITSYEQTLAVIPEYNLKSLTTDFWKHGQSGIIDIKDKIKPCHWYGKQHPFEFEFVVVDNPSIHKIFNNLQIISNKAKPDSFHYEIIGECFDFFKDKKNLFIRQEATRDFYQYNGSNVTYNEKFLDLEGTQNKKSITMPNYYSRVDTINEVEDSYKQITSPNKDYSNLSGSEIVYYDNLNEFRIWNHSKAVDIEEEGGRIRGNMNYQEDKWDVQINPIIIVEKNENPWNSQNEQGENISPKVPITIGNSPIPEDFIGDQITKNNIPENLLAKGYTLKDIDISDWGVYPVSIDEQGNILYADAGTRKEVKVKDKFMKVRIRYSGEDVAVITALKTIYNISYA